jgi:aryl-alcohol dehydrogenase-like predicted oxidoreductase
MMFGEWGFQPSQIVEGQWAARDRPMQRFISEQPPSMLTRGIEADVLPTCARYGMAVIPCGCQHGAAACVTFA